MNYKRMRIRVLVDTWSEIAQKSLSNRDEVIELLKRNYKENSLQPIRGASTPPDLFEKEMISLYIVGKYGLGLNKEFDEAFFRKLFDPEIKLENALRVLERCSSEDEFLKELKDLGIESVDDKFIAKMLRFAFTLMYFGFIDENKFRDILVKAYRVLRSYEQTVKRFTKFFIAYKVGEMISCGKVKNRMGVMLAKNSLAAELGIPRSVPSNSYIVDVAIHYFTLPQKLAEELKKSREE